MPADALRERWRAESLASVWLRAGDWYHPAVDALTHALSAATDPMAAVELLGHARGYDGVGVGETIDDLACLYRTLGSAQPPLAVVRALCIGWAEAQAEAVTTGPSIDAASGLPSRQYLAVRLGEVYGGVAGRSAQRLLLVDVAAGDVDALTGGARSAAVGAALTEVFLDGRPMAALGGGVYAVLVSEPDKELRDRLDLLRVEIARRCHALGVEAFVRRPIRLLLRDLPASRAEAVALLERAAHT